MEAKLRQVKATILKLSEPSRRGNDRMIYMKWGLTTVNRGSGHSHVSKDTVYILRISILDLYAMLQLLKDGIYSPFKCLADVSVNVRLLLHLDALLV